MGQDPIPNPIPNPNPNPVPGPSSQRWSAKARAAGLKVSWLNRDDSRAPYRETSAGDSVVITVPPPAKVIAALVSTGIGVVMAWGAAALLLVVFWQNAAGSEDVWPVLLLVGAFTLGGSFALQVFVKRGLVPLLHRTRISVSRMEISVLWRSDGRAPLNIKDVQRLECRTRTVGEGFEAQQVHDLLAVMDDDQLQPVLEGEPNLPRTKVIKRIIEQRLGLHDGPPTG